MPTSYFSSQLVKQRQATQPVALRKTHRPPLISTGLVIVLLALLLEIPFILTNPHLSIREQWLWLGCVLGGCFIVVALLDRTTR